MSTTVLCDLLCFFFFKQKTAYEMRISDWSSDVCSSDLFRQRLIRAGAHDFQNDVLVHHQAFARRGFVSHHAQIGATVCLVTINTAFAEQIGRASCRERVCQLRVDLGGRRIIKQKKEKTNYINSK